MSNNPANRQNISTLDGARGVASIIVIMHHMALAFIPSIKTESNSLLINLPLYWTINGSAAVNFFFVLSGFVLTFGFFNCPDARTLFIAGAKRTPRLLPPASLSILAGYCILASGMNYNEPAAALSHSEWLRTFANSLAPEGFTPSLADALQQSILVFFVPRNFYYNSNLWTMRYELFGSFLVFGLAAIQVYGFRRRFAPMFFSASLMVLLFMAPALLGFVSGTFLAFLLSGSQKHIPLWLGVLGVTAGLVCCSTGLLHVQVIGSTILIAVLIMCAPLSRPLSGRIGYWLGQLSFPLYLVHTLVICSLSSWVYWQLSASQSSQFTILTTTAAVTIAASLLASLPFIALERWWVPWLNRLSQSTFSRAAAWVSWRRPGSLAPDPHPRPGPREVVPYLPN